MTQSQRIEIRRSEIRQRLAELAGTEDPSEEQLAEIGQLETEYRQSETRLRAALLAEEEAEAEAAAKAGDVDAETRERIELRSRASVGRYLRAALRGRLPDGAEHELMEAAGIDDGIPLELWDTAALETGQAEAREVTGAPGTVGVNLDTIRPAIFAPSIVPRLGVEMPRVESGTYASATIKTSLTAAAKGKSEAAEATAAAFAVTTATPKRVSARLSLTLEDIAAVGAANFEAALRENLSLALSDKLDDQALNGDGSDNDLTGLFQRLTDPNAPAAGVAGFDAFVSAFADGIDGLWASRMNEVAIVCGPETYRLSAKTFRDRVIDTGQRGGVSLGDTSFADYAMGKFGGWWTNKRMPVKANHIQQAILHRRGRSGIRTAVCPHWGRIGIDDIYSGSAKAERHFTFHVLLGDVILVQPDAYKQVSFRVST
ncbi:MAG: phage major capsid protein [Gemmatimonadota bacterium]|nr:phage major capsid protein [Gemmatimonadota bacterium]